MRLAAGWGWQARLERTGKGPFGLADSEGYWALARSIARAEPYQYGPEQFRVFRTPGYPILLAPVFLLGGENPSPLWGRALSALFDTLAVAGVGLLAWRLGGPWSGVVAAGILAVYPGAIATGVLVLSEAAFCPLMLGHLALWMAAWEAPTIRRAGWLAGAAGLLAGAATLVRPSWLLFVPFAAGLGILFGRARRRHLVLGAVMMVSLAIAMLPWWLRNARLTGRFVPTTLQVGASLYDAWNPQATGASDFTVVREAADAIRRQIQAGQPPAATPQDWEYELDRRLRHEAIHWARSHPGRAVQLAWIKLRRMWNIWPNEPSLAAWPIRWGWALSYVPILALAIWGAAKSLRRGWPYVLCCLPALYLTLLHMVFVSSIRYRQPALAPLVILAAQAIHLRRQTGRFPTPDPGPFAAGHAPASRLPATQR
ncbi:MAG: hypothetical protein ACUVUC_12035 [Thermoguttaceae bacterium]